MSIPETTDINSQDELAELRYENINLRASEITLGQAMQDIQLENHRLALQITKRTSDLVRINKALQEAILRRERLEETLRQKIAELEERNEELDAFARTVAHDLKNPIGALTGLAEILREDYSKMDQGDLGEYLEAMVRSGRKATTIVDELLLLAQLRRQEVPTASLDMGAIIEEVVIRLDHIIVESQTEIQLPDTWPTAQGYGPWIEEVWTNYISNGLKYGGTPPQLKLGAISQPDGTIQFFIQDNGPGLTQEEQDRLFVPFTQLKGNPVKGYGLGLSIVRRIVEKLGGYVGVESAGPGQGSMFYFCLRQ